MTSMGASAGGPQGWVQAQLAMSSALVGVMVARWKRATSGEPRHDASNHDLRMTHVWGPLVARCRQCLGTLVQNGSV